MGTAKMDAWMRKNGFKLVMMPDVSTPDGWRKLALSPLPKGMLATYPRDRKKGVQAADVPDCALALKSVKKEILKFTRNAKIKTPEAAAKWRMVYEVANLDSCLLDGIADELARRCTVRAILHLLSRFSTFIKAVEGEMSFEEVQKLIAETRAENRAEHEVTRTAAKDAALEKRPRGGQKKEREARVQEAMDKMAKLIRDLGMSIPEAGHEVWEGYVQKKEPLGISESRLINRYYDERGPKSYPRKPDPLP